MKIYTRRGDDGSTGLFAGPRVWKDDDRIEAYGTVDELGAVLGWVRTLGLVPERDRVLERVQHRLFAVGASLATPDPEGKGRGGRAVGPGELAGLEGEIDRVSDRLAPLTEFILAGGTPQAAALHLARVVCRRAERRVVSLARRQQVDPAVVAYLNRLSDLLFVLAREANARAGQPDVAWRKGAP